MKSYSVKFNAWEVLETDGFGVGEDHLAYFSTKREADKFASQFKSHRRVREVTIDKCWVVCDTVEELEEMAVLNKKAAALAKLTEEERKLLGLE